LRRVAILGRIGPTRNMFLFNKNTRRTSEDSGISSRPSSRQTLSSNSFADGTVESKIEDLYGVPNGHRRSHTADHQKKRVSMFGTRTRSNTSTSTMSINSAASSFTSVDTISRRSSTSGKSNNGTERPESGMKNFFFHRKDKKSKRGDRNFSLNSRYTPSPLDGISESERRESREVSEMVSMSSQASEKRKSPGEH
jgi:hypothetical protein